MPDEETKWTFGMVATYGLRPEEIFINLNLEDYLSPSNTINIFPCRQRLQNRREKSIAA